MSSIDAMTFWIGQLANRNKDTVRNYKIYLRKFCGWVGKSPNELIEMKKEALDHDGDRRENMVLEGKLKEFMYYMEYDAVTQQGNQGYGLGSRRIAYSAVVSFFDLNQYPLSMKRGDRPTGEAMGSRIPEKEEIVKLVNTARSRRHRCTILFLKDSGLRLSDAVRLRWEDVQDFGDGFYGFKLITRKRRVKALPFIGPETTTALDQLPRKKARIFPITAKTLSNRLSVLIEEAGLEKGLKPHGLRKYFNTEMEAARVQKEYRYAMMGKRIGVYDENRQRKLFEIYRQAYGNLRCLSDVVIRQDEIEAIVERRVQERVASVQHELAELRQRQKGFENPLFVEWLEQKMHELEQPEIKQNEIEALVEKRVQARLTDIHRELAELRRDQTLLNELLDVARKSPEKMKMLKRIIVEE